MASWTFTICQVCQIVTGEDGDMNFMSPGSDDDLDMEDWDDPERQSETATEVEQS